MVTAILILVCVLIVVGVVGLLVMACDGCILSQIQLGCSAGKMIEAIGILILEIIKGFNES